MITGFSHVSIVVPDIEAAARTLADRYGLTVGERKLNEQQGVRLAYVEVGAAKIELMEPSRPDSPVAKFLERNPKGGIHHFSLAVGNDGQFARTAEVLGHPEWASDPRFKANRARVENRAAIDGLIGEVLARDSADAWLVKLKAAGVPCGKINSVAGALADPHTAARNMIETVEHPTVGALKMLGIPFKFSDTPTSVRCAPPTLGQHTDEVLKSELGLDDDAIAQLRRENAV